MSDLMIEREAKRLPYGYTNKFRQRYCFICRVCGIMGWVIFMNELKNRKTTRLKGADYSRNQVVFLTICTKERQCLLSRIVGTGVPDGPQIELTQYGQIADKYIKQLNEFYNDLSVERYVIMPNHIHILLWVKGNENGPSRTPVPTVQNSIPARFVSTFKRFCNKEYKKNIWQYRSNDHIIRNREDYEEHVKYIYENPLQWYYDELYAEE